VATKDSNPLMKISIDDSEYMVHQDAYNGNRYLLLSTLDRKSALLSWNNTNLARKEVYMIQNI
jgi:hypothetical protein